jgi:hypothetical protein
VRRYKLDKQGVRAQFPVQARGSFIFRVSLLFLGLMQTSYSVDGRHCFSGGEADLSLPLSIEVKLA